MFLVDHVHVNLINNDGLTISTSHRQDISCHWVL